MVKILGELLCSVVRYSFHRAGHLHRDVKPENVLRLFPTIAVVLFQTPLSSKVHKRVTPSYRPSSGTDVKMATAAIPSLPSSPQVIIISTSHTLLRAWASDARPPVSSIPWLTETGSNDRLKEEEWKYSVLAQELRDQIYLEQIIMTVFIIGTKLGKTLDEEQWHEHLRRTGILDVREREETIQQVMEESLKKQHVLFRVTFKQGVG